MTPDTSFRPGPPPLNLQQAKRGRGGILLGLSIAGLFLPILAAISFFLSRADLQAIARGEIEEGERPATHTSLVVASVGCGLWGVAIAFAVASTTSAMTQVWLAILVCSTVGAYVLRHDLSGRQ
jgi:hypothetical protein